MPDNRNKTGSNQDKQQQPMKKPEQPQQEREGMGNRSSVGNKNLDKDVGNEDRDIQKDIDTDETDVGETDEQGEITQRNPRQGGDDDQRR